MDACMPGLLMWRFSSGDLCMCAITAAMQCVWCVHADCGVGIFPLRMRSGSKLQSCVELLTYGAQRATTDTADTAVLLHPKQHETTRGPLLHWCAAVEPTLATHRAWGDAVMRVAVSGHGQT